jgi:hypothetical protein
MNNLLTRRQRNTVRTITKKIEVLQNQVETLRKNVDKKACDLVDRNEDDRAEAYSTVEDSFSAVYYELKSAIGYLEDALNSAANPEVM